MSNTTTELDCARAILTTYHQVHDAPSNQQRILRTKLQEKNKELEQELQTLKDQYMILQNELSNRDERLARLNRQLIDRTTNMVRLQEDFENAIYQLTQHKDQS
jgi:predicted  nucleic acid-binding Zn-ribbon protein